MIRRIVNGQVLMADGTLAAADVVIDNERIGAVGASARSGTGATLDGRGLFVLPGIVDLHGDGFERSVMPRSGVTFDLPVALAEADRGMVAHGITTGYLGLTVSWEPGLRSPEAGQRTMDAINMARATAGADLRVQIRWETYALDAVDMVIGWLDDPVPPLLAYNDHTTQTFENRTDPKKLAKWAQRSDLTPAQYVALVERIAERRAEVPAAMQRLAAAARARGLIQLSHDDRTVEDRDRFRALGTTIAEFPLTRPAIEHAKLHGEPTVLGAPNVLRGGSHTGALGAREMVLEGLCDVLASDYYYPAQLAAAFKLIREDSLPLARVWPLVSTNAAAAAGLADRGRIEEGQRADLVLVDATGRYPVAVATLTAGRLVHLARDIIG